MTNDAIPATIADIFRRSVSEYALPDALNYRSDGEWKSISSADVLRRAECVAAGLRSIGLDRGDRAAILAANSPEWTLADAGCQFAGVIDVPIYTTLTPDSVRYILADSESRLLFVDTAAAYERIRDAVADLASLEHIIVFDNTNEIESAITFAELIRRGEQHLATDPDCLERIRAEISSSDIATLIYTSGTTGEPKGVMLTHSNIVSNVIGAAERYAFSGQDVSLSVLPLSHVFERTGMYVYLMYGMRVHYAESIEKVPDNLQEVRPTIFIGVPRIFEKVFERARMKASQAGRLSETIFDWATDVAKQYASLNESGEAIPLSLTAKHGVADKLVFAKLRDFFGGRLRFCITGGAALPDEIYLIFTGAGISIMQGYGLTETSPVISSNNPSAVRVGTVGKPIRDVEVRIAQDGEIEVRGPGIMKGYYHKEKETTEVFTTDGWFRTGDIGRLDDDGFLMITDRKKELFKTSGGKYIAPTPIEQMLRSSRFINQAVLVGNERKFAAALIVPNFEMLESYAQLKELDVTGAADLCDHPKIIDLIRRQIESATGNLSQFEKVKKFALLENELTVDGGELTPTLKVKRRVVDDKYRGVIDEMYSNGDQ